MENPIQPDIRLWALARPWTIALYISYTLTAQITLSGIFYTLFTNGINGKRARLY